MYISLMICLESDNFNFQQGFKCSYFDFYRWMATGEDLSSITHIKSGIMEFYHTSLTAPFVCYVFFLLYICASVLKNVCTGGGDWGWGKVRSGDGGGYNGRDLFWFTQFSSFFHHGFLSRPFPLACPLFV